MGRDTSRWRIVAAATIILLAGLTVYANSFAGEFVLDDHLWIVLNPTIRHLWPPGTVLFPKDAFSSGRPVLNLSLAASYALSGMNVWGYHAVNVGIHLLAALALFGVVRRTLLTPRLCGRFGRFSTALALAIALLWVVHPLGTAAVTYIIQRTEALAALFYLLTLYCVIRGENSARSAAWYCAAIVSCFLGMATKEVMVTAPVFVLLYDRTLLSGSFAAAFKKRWWMYCCLAATWGVVWWSLVSTGFHSDSTGFGVKGFTPLAYAATEPGVILHYLRLAVWPVGLVLDYDWPAVDSVAAIVPPAIVIAVLLGLTIWGLVKNKPAALLGAWFFGILAPTSTFIPIRDAAFEHRIYLPLAAVIAIFVIGGYAFWQSLRRRWHAVEGTGKPQDSGDPSLTRRVSKDGDPLLARRVSNDGDPLLTCRESDELLETRRVSEGPRELLETQRMSDGLELLETRRVSEGRSRLLCSFALAVIAVCLGWQTIRRNADYADAEQLWRLTIDARPANARAHSNLAAILYDRGKYDEAIDHSSRALALRGDFPEAETTLGAALARKRQFDEAFRHFDRALKLRPGEERATELKCEALVAAGKLDAAISVCDCVLSVDSHNGKFRLLLADSLMKLGRTDEAIEQYKLATADDPDSATAENVRGGLLARRGELDQAIPHFEASIRLNPNLPDPNYNLGMIHYGRGEYADAERYWRKAVMLRPDSVEYLRPLAWLLATSNDSAVRNGREAVELAKRAMAASATPDPNIIGTLAAAYAESGDFARAVTNAEKALDLAKQQGNERLANELAARVADYRAGRPYREMRAAGK